MSNKLKQITAIRVFDNDDVRDPQATIAAIEKVLSAADTPVATIRVFDNPDSKGPLKTTVAIDYSDSRIEPRHTKAVVLAISDFAIDRANEEECNDPECPLHGDGTSDLAELFRKFEEAAPNKKGGDK